MMVKYIFFGMLVVFLVNASCYEHPGLGWRWNDTHIGSVLNIYDHVRIDLTKRECADKARQALFGLPEAHFVA